MTNKSCVIQLEKKAAEIENTAAECHPRLCATCKFQLNCAKVMRAAASKIRC